MTAKNKSILVGVAAFLITGVSLLVWGIQSGNIKFLADQNVPVSVVPPAVVISANAGTYDEGDDVIVTVAYRTNSADLKLSIAGAYISYPADNLETSAAAVTTSALATKSVAAGVVRVSAVSTTGLTGNGNIATIKFKAIKASTQNLSLVATPKFVELGKASQGYIANATGNTVTLKIASVVSPTPTNTKKPTVKPTTKVPTVKPTGGVTVPVTVKTTVPVTKVTTKVTTPVVAKTTAVVTSPAVTVVTTPVIPVYTTATPKPTTDQTQFALTIGVVALLVGVGLGLGLFLFLKR